MEHRVRSLGSATRPTRPSVAQQRDEEEAGGAAGSSRRQPRRGLPVQRSTEGPITLTMRVLLLVILMACPAFAAGVPASPAEVYDPSRLHVIHLSISAEGW